MTPHPVMILDEANNLIRTIPVSGNLIRLKAQTVSCGEADGIKLSTTKFGEPEGLPDASGDKLYIVSQLVKSALPDRADLVVPAEVQRDQAGNIIGCRSLGV